jgi:hypothetical protein
MTLSQEGLFTLERPLLATPLQSHFTIDKSRESGYMG